MFIRRLTFAALIVAVPLLFGACKKDSSLKASKTDCDDACTHATALHSGKKDAFSRQCPSLCVAKEWTLGDVKCVNEAASYDDVKNCGAVAKAIIDMKESKAGRGGKHKRKRKGKGKHRRDAEQAASADPAATAPAPAPSAPPAE